MKPEELFKENTKIAYKIANKYSKSGEKDDITQMALEGLWKSCIKYNPELGYAFSTFSYYYIEGEIRRRVRDGYFKNIRLPRTSIDAKIKICKDKALGLTEDEILKKNNLSRKEFECYDKLYENSETTSLDCELDGVKLKDVIDTNVESLEDEIILNSIIGKSLNDFQNSILRETLNGYTQREIGDRLNCSQVKISRELKKITLKLKEVLL